MNVGDDREGGRAVSDGGIASCTWSPKPEPYEFADLLWMYCGWVCNGSGDQAELWSAEGIGGCDGDGALAESGGLGLPNIADRIEYSKFAASEPNAKLGSKLRLNRGSAVAGNGSGGGIGTGMGSCFSLGADCLFFSCSSSSSSSKYLAFLRCPSTQQFAIPRLIHRWQGRESSQVR